MRKLFCLGVAVVCTFIALNTRAQVEVDWDFFNGFSPSAITINAGDEVDFFNTDSSGNYLNLTGAPPESFSPPPIPPTPDGMSFYYFPWVYNNPGVFTAYDDQFDTVTITVNAVVPLAVNITDPSSNAVFFAPATFPVTAVPSGGATPYSDVQFLVGTNDAGDILSSPFTTGVTNLPAGSYVISAIVTDNNFDTASNSITISVVPPLQLTAARAGKQIIISWPTNNAGGFSLQWATNLQSGATWNAVTQTPGLIGTNWVVTNSISKTNAYFRLSSQ